MDLNILWFILIAVLYSGYFILEGFDFGIGILYPFIGKSDQDRRVMLNAIGPVWDANEVWLVLAGGATFAAFPNWYATLFSGFYLPLFLILLALIFRGVTFEFRSKVDNKTWRNFWDGAFFVGSLLPPLLLGVAFANMLQGVPIDAKMNYTGGFFNLLNPFALLGGLSFLGMSILLGSLFLKLKVNQPLVDRAEKAARVLWYPVFVLVAAFAVFAYITKSGTSPLSVVGLVVSVLAFVALVLSMLMSRSGRIGWSFGLACAAMAGLVITIFVLLFPDVMVSSTDPVYSLTIYNASSSAKTLGIMSIVALIFLPVVLLYQGWNYWIFRKRLSSTPEDLHY